MTSLADAKAACARQAALQQRARLLGAISADVNGPLSSAACGHLPARLLSRRVSTAIPLETYAAHLIYCPDGEWRVVRDDVGQHPAAALLHAPLLAVFLPALCRRLFGQSLLLGSAPTWWLGDPETRQAVARNPRRFWMRDGLEPMGRRIALAEMSAAERVRIQGAVAADPGSFVVGLNFAEPVPIRRVTYDTAQSVVEADDRACV